MICAVVIILNVDAEKKASVVKSELNVSDDGEIRHKMYAELLNKIWDTEKEHDPEVIQNQLKELFYADMRGMKMNGAGFLSKVD